LTFIFTVSHDPVTYHEQSNHEQVSVKDFFSFLKITLLGRADYFTCDLPG